MTDQPQTEDPMVAALLRERVGYVSRGMTDRVAQVDEQLELRGYTPQPETPAEDPAEETSEETSEGDAAAAQEETRATPPRRRSARSTEQA